MLNIAINQETNVKYLIYDQTGELVSGDDPYIVEYITYGGVNDTVSVKTMFVTDFDTKIVPGDK